MGEGSNFLIGGGYVAGVVGLGLTLRYLAQAWRTWRASRRDGQDATMTDAATTNTMLLNSLTAEREENRRLHEHIDELEAEVDELRDQLFTQRSEYEQQLTDLRRQLQSMTNQLDALQERIQQGGTPA